MQQNTPEWLEMRRSKIGASDAAAIMGVCPYATPYQKWEEKVLGKSTYQNEAMRKGHELEPIARALFEETTGITTMPKVCFSSEYEWQMASLDGISFDGDFVLELKCPTKRKLFDDALKGRVPEFYKVQHQHQFSVSKAKKGAFAVFFQNEIAIVETFPDDKFIKKMIKSEEKFYQLMVDKIPPELTERDYRKFTDSKILQLSEYYEEAKTQADIHYQAAEKYKDDLKEAIGYQNSIVGKLRITRSNPEGRIDYANVPELIGVDLEKYRKPSCEKWTFTIQDD